MESRTRGGSRNRKRKRKKKERIMAAKIKGIEGEGNCEMCGTYCPKRRIALEIESGEVVLYGSECAKILLNTTTAKVTAMARRMEDRKAALTARIANTVEKAYDLAKVYIKDRFAHNMKIDRLFPVLMFRGDYAEFAKITEEEKRAFEALGFSEFVINRLG
jgi:Pyruvate/2-oxoacid:ferredoxin oxidoreductase delta subunit